MQSDFARAPKFSEANIFGFQINIFIDRHDQPFLRKKIRSHWQKSPQTLLQVLIDEDTESYEIKYSFCISSLYLYCFLHAFRN